MEYNTRSRSPLNNILVCREKHNNRETRLWEKRVLPIIIIMLIIIALFIVACYNFSYHILTRLCILMNLKYKTQEEEEVSRAVITMTISRKRIINIFSPIRSMDCTMSACVCAVDI